jgi:UDP-N-acetylmuramate dehydrogenase
MPVKDDLLADLNVRCEFNVPLAPLTWYGVGGPAAVIAHPANTQQLAAVAQRCHEAGVRTYVLGSGANLLVRDEGVPDGVVVRLDDPHWRDMKIDGNIVTVGAGYDLSKLVLETAKAGLGGLEALAGIPASVGGAIRMNAGGAYGEIGPTVRRLEVMSEGGQVFYRDRDDLVFTYRKSNIIARYILIAELELTPDDADQLMKQVKEVFLYKKTTQPLAEHSAGCAFKNPLAEPEGGSTQRQSAGKLIDQAGLKGHRIGCAAVSDRHANFIYIDRESTATPRADDVLALMDHVQATVREHHGVELEREVVVWP